MLPLCIPGASLVHPLYPLVHARLSASAVAPVASNRPGGPPGNGCPARERVWQTHGCSERSHSPLLQLDWGMPEVFSGLSSTATATGDLQFERRHGVHLQPAKRSQHIGRQRPCRRSRRPCETIMDNAGPSQRQSEHRTVCASKHRRREMKLVTTATRDPLPAWKPAIRAAGFSLNRRQFLKTALQAGALLAAPQVIPGAVLGRDGGVAPSERIVLGGIGIGNRGTYDLGCFLEEPDVQFVAICDVKAARREAIKKKADDKYGNQDCATYRDLRELLARSDIDAVLIATGPNWHATASILAANAGKDVYCEKPCTKNIAQSLALAETFRRTGRVFQAGTQRRSLPNFAFAVDLARRGKLGKLQTLYAHPGGLANRHQRLAAAPEPEPDKEQVDWDLYLGPAAWRPLQQEAARWLQLRERRRPDRRRLPGMGLPLRGPLPMGQRRRPHRAGRVRAAGQRTARPLRQRRQARHARRRLAPAGLLPGPLRGRHRLGRNRR